MASIEITNAHGHTVTITADDENLVSFVKHLKYHASLVMTKCMEENAQASYDSARRDFDAYDEALQIYRAER